MTATILASRIVDRLAERVGPAEGPTRRSFLVRAAVVGAALAANPVRLLLRPGTAYASICGPGAECGEGWAVMCCTINGGANTCPPGSFAAGWWKADNSGFCGGPRYYVDCNRVPWDPAACGCHCHDDPSTCDHRRVCCNVFRYGQCHLEIGGVTPVVCRVVTCTPPWEWDPACSPSSRTDNATTNHTADCLPGPGATAIQLRYQDLGLLGAALGRQVGPERPAPDEGGMAPFENGIIAWRADTGAHEIRGAIHARHEALGGLGGWLGYPMTDERPAGDGRGRYSRFTGGAVYWTGTTGAFEVHGWVLAKYDALGGPRGPLGYPLSDESPAPNGRQSRFENGTIAWRPDIGVWAVQGIIHHRWEVLGGVDSPLGYPLSDELGFPDRRGRLSWFERGAILFTPTTGAVEVRGAILDAWYGRGGPGHAVGYPVGPEQPVAGGAEQAFERGVFTYRTGGAAFGVWGAIGGRWRGLGAQASRLGYPLTDEQRLTDGRGRVSWFEGGAIFWTPTTGAHDVDSRVLDAWYRLGGPLGRLGYPIGDQETVDATHQRVRFERGSLVADLATGSVVEQ